MASAASLRTSPRAAKRMRVLVSGTLFTPSGAQRVLVRDISQTGALIGCEGPVPPNCDAIFKRGDLFAAAHVAWSVDHEAGLRFYRELTSEEVKSALPPPAH